MLQSIMFLGSEDRFGQWRRHMFEHDRLLLNLLQSLLLIGQFRQFCRQATELTLQLQFALMAGVQLFLLSVQLAARNRKEDLQSLALATAVFRQLLKLRRLLLDFVHVPREILEFLLGSHKLWRGRSGNFLRRVA